MDLRGRPWIKRSSGRTLTDNSVPTPDLGSFPSVSFAAAVPLGDQANNNKVSYVQLSLEKFTYLMGLEDQVKTLNDEVKMLEDQVKELNEELSEAHSEMIKKDSVVQQHAEVAEEAISGWETADAQTIALKHRLESVMLLRLNAEERASYLEVGLKECMRQIRIVNEENEKLNEVVYSKAKQWDKIKLDLQGKISELDQEIFRSAAENAALLRSLQERSNMLTKIDEEESQTEVEIDLKVHPCEKEPSPMKYDNENLNVRSAEIADNQYLEGVERIANLEGESQRLRGIVRKKFPSPACLAQKNLDVENLNPDSGESHWRRSAFNNMSPGLRHSHNETESFATHLLAMEKEIKMLKEALTAHNSEVETLRNMCFIMAGRMRGLEARKQILEEQRNSPDSNASKPPSHTSMSDNGGDEEESMVESWAGASVITDLSHRRNRITENFDRSENHLKLMDFLEMERLTSLSSNHNGSSDNKVSRGSLRTLLGDCH